MKYSPSRRFQLCGESVILPFVEGYGDVQQIWGEDCPVPRFRRKGIVTEGWQARGKWEIDPFESCHSRLKEISFFIFPSPGSPPTLRVASRQAYQTWKKMAQSPASCRILAETVLAAIDKLVGNTGDAGEIIDVAGGDNEGFPFVAGKIKSVDHSEKSRFFYFATALTVVGETWVAPVIVADKEIKDISIAEDVIALAKATYHLNKDYRGPKRRKSDPTGPFLKIAP